MVASDDIRRETAGSDARLCASASREAGSAVNGESRAAGPATGKVVVLISGGELHAEQAGSRVNIVILTGKGLRNRLTASLSPADAERFFNGGAEIVALARSYRQAKGA